MLLKVLDQIRKVSKAFEVFGGLIPAPPHAELQGNHLFLNYRYELTILAGSSSDQLITVRDEFVASLKVIIDSGIVGSIKSVCLSAFLPYEGENQRIYRYNILASQLTVPSQELNADYVRNHAYSEIVDSKLLKKLSDVCPPSLRR
jgi:hypothetical protein